MRLIYFNKGRKRRRVGGQEVTEKEEEEGETRNPRLTFAVRRVEGGRGRRLKG